MMLNNKIKLATLFAAATLGAQGGLITSPPAGATTTVFATGSSCSASDVDAGFTVTGSAACTNYSGFYGLGDNGFWNPTSNGFALIGNNTATSSIIINLGGLYSSVGGFVNYDTPVTSGCGEGGCTKDPVIIALGANQAQLAIYDINVMAPINTPNGVNAGAFIGIQDATNDIAYLELSFDYLTIHSITLESTADSSTTPEPSSVLLLGSGLALLLAASRRRFS